MAEHDLLDEELHALARVGEDQATDGWSPQRVRRAGSRRRQRRVISGVVAATVAAVALGGGVVLSSTLRSGTQQPGPVQTPSAVPSRPTEAARALSARNLLQTSDITTYGGDQKVVITDPDLGRPIGESSVCLSEGLTPLGAEQVLSRNFRISFPGEPTSTAGPGDELAQQPSIYTQALQFADAATAARAYRTYGRWVAGCVARITERGYTPIGSPLRKPVEVRTGVAGTSGEFSEVMYRTPGQSQDYGWFEAVGLTLAGDRMMITISLLVGQDKNVAYEQFPKDPDLAAPHEQFGLIMAAARRIGA